jgi:hypothetical protein
VGTGGAWNCSAASNGTANPGVFTTLSASSTVSGAGFTARFATPGPIGNTVASTGAFTTLAASTTATVTSASANALAVGLTGATNPAFNVDSSTASQVAGLDVVGAATGGNVAIKTTDSGSANNLTINALGTGTITLNGTATGATVIGHGLTSTAGTSAFGVTNFSLGLVQYGSTTPVHIAAGQTTPPTLSSCGTGAVVGNATDIAGEVHATGATACTVAWTGTFTAQPYCVATDATTAAGLKVAYNTTVSFTVTGLTSGDTFTYVCIGQAGG